MRLGSSGARSEVWGGPRVGREPGAPKAGGVAERGARGGARAGGPGLRSTPRRGPSARRGSGYSLGLVGETGGPGLLVAVQVTVEHVEAEAAHLGGHHHFPGGRGRRGRGGGGGQERGHAAAGGCRRGPPAAARGDREGAAAAAARQRAQPVQARPSAAAAEPQVPGAGLAVHRAVRSRRRAPRAGRGRAGQFLLLHPAAARRHLAAGSPRRAAEPRGSPEPAGRGGEHAARPRGPPGAAPAPARARGSLIK